MCFAIKLKGVPECHKSRMELTYPTSKTGPVDGMAARPLRLEYTVTLQARNVSGECCAVKAATLHARVGMGRRIPDSEHLVSIIEAFLPIPKCIRYRTIN